MIHGRIENNLILIENGRICSYVLDDKKIWEVGRPSKDNIPDIKLHSATASRKHGKFQNMDGVWFYLDYKGKNGTFYNHHHLDAGINGRIKPVMLKNGDVFVFGCGKEEVINCKTIWAMFVTKIFDGTWRLIDTKGCKTIKIIYGEGSTTLGVPPKGFVFEKKTGIAIFMGDLTYAIGDIEIICS